jgi:hypothetical protein
MVSTGALVPWTGSCSKNTVNGIDWDLQIAFLGNNNLEVGTSAKGFKRPNCIAMTQQKPSFELAMLYQEHID